MWATIRRNIDGETRECEVPGPDWTLDEDGGYDTELFIWEDGNFACDCNRELFFERVTNPNFRHSDEDSPCGDERYSVLSFRMTDGRVIVSREC